MIETIQYYALSDIGLRRKRNEDAYVVYASPEFMSQGNGRGWLFAVADGIGGHTCGDRASRIACDLLKDYFSNNHTALPQNHHLLEIERFVRSIDRQIKQAASEDPECEDMGTTLSAMVLAENFAYLAHVGDSRIYRYRNRQLDQLTKDNTFVQEMIDEGELTKDEAVHHPLRNMLTRALGTPEPLEGIEVASVSIADGDCFLLSSDGLHGLVPRKTIEDTLKHSAHPRPTAQKLLQAALTNGGKDNITLIVIHT